MIAEPCLSVCKIAEHLCVMRDPIYEWMDRKGRPSAPHRAIVEVSGARSG